MKTLFISFDTDFPLYTEGNIVVFKHDLLNDLFYELGSELTFLSKSELSTDKNALIADFKNDCPEEFKTFSQDILKIATKKLLEEDSKSESHIRVDLPETYIEWLKYHPNPEYQTIGRMENLLYIDIAIEDLTEYVAKFLNTIVKKAIETDLSIEKFTFVEAINEDADYIKQITSLRNNLAYEPYDGSWIQCEVAAAFWNGIGATKDIPKSLTHYLRATEHGNGIAANWLGWCYQTGNGIEKDEVKALEYYKKGSELGNINSDANLGYCYHLGVGTPVDYGQAVNYYQKGAEGGITFAQVNLANIYYDGHIGSPDYEEAFKWYYQGAQGDNNYAQYKAGEMLINGLGVTIDIPKGLSLLKKSALGGNVNASLLYAREICKTSDMKAIQETVEILDNCENGKQFQNKDPEVFYVEGEIIYKYFGKDSIDDAIQKLTYAQDLGYEPAGSLINQIKQENQEEEERKERRFNQKMESLMKKAFYTQHEVDFLEGNVGEEELIGCMVSYPKDWETDYIITDKFGVEYNQKFHRLLSAKKSIFNWFYRRLLLMEAEEYIKERDKATNPTYIEMHAEEEVKKKYFEKSPYLGFEHDDRYDIAEGTEIICCNAFENCSYIRSISIPSTVKSIGQYALRGLNISDLVIPESVEEIGVDALGESLKTVTILNGNIRVICTSDEDGRVMVPCDENRIDDLFNGCRELESVFVPKGFKDRLASMFPSVKDKLVEITDSKTSSSATEGESKKDCSTTISSGARNESKSNTDSKRRPSETTETKSSQSKKSKKGTTSKEDKTKSPQKGSGEIVPTQKTNLASSESSGIPKSDARKKTTTTKKTIEMEKNDVVSSDIKNTQEKQSFFSKLKNFFK